MVADRRLISLDLTASFAFTPQPTPFGLFDSDLVFQQDADAMVRFVYTKLGGRMLGVELTNREVYAAFEEAMLEYSAMVNSYQAKSVITSVLGSPTGSLITTGEMPRFSLDQAVRQSEAYSSEALVGGVRALHSSSVLLSPGQQHYDLNAMLSASGELQPGQQIRIGEVLHFSPSFAFPFMDPGNVFNYLNTEFHFESFTWPEAVFYMLPVWQDVLRQQEMKMSMKIRRSNYSYNIVNNVLTLYPAPTIAMPVYFTYYIVNDNPWANSISGVTTNISNIPFGNIIYANLNAIGLQWVRRFAFALAKETLGQVRSKIADIPIPDGTLTLNGLELVAQAREEQSFLRDDLMAILESMTYSNLATAEYDQADALQRQLGKVPLLPSIG